MILNILGGGIYDIKKTLKPMDKVLNKYLNITDSPVVKIIPESNTIETRDGRQYTYDQLIVSSGINLDFD